MLKTVLPSNPTQNTAMEPAMYLNSTRNDHELPHQYLLEAIATIAQSLHHY
eukprot:m.11361 g.11361  ORF g.11361 m.11361 type:complete len:51 (+) comp9798_c0_seq1:438-590(+)